MSVRAYTARAMTGLPWHDIYHDALTDSYRLRDRGVIALDPVLAEVDDLGYLPSGNVGDGPPADLTAHWRRDKRMIRQAHVLIDFSPEHKSEGIAHEIGYARYELWKPIVRVYRKRTKPTVSIAYFENDVVVESLEAAAAIVVATWGTWPKRFVWRLKMYLRCYPKHLWRKLGEWK